MDVVGSLESEKKVARNSNILVGGVDVTGRVVCPQSMMGEQVVEAFNS